MTLSDIIVLGVGVSPGLWMLFVILTEDYKYDPDNWAD